MNLMPKTGSHLHQMSIAILTDGKILQHVLPSFDQETTDFFRWKVEYLREQLEEILYAKSGIDFGTSDGYRSCTAWSIRKDCQIENCRIETDNDRWEGIRDSPLDVEITFVFKRIHCEN